MVTSGWSIHLIVLNMNTLDQTMKENFIFRAIRLIKRIFDPDLLPPRLYMYSETFVVIYTGYAITVLNMNTLGQKMKKELL